jgi:hypothetical protein
MSVLIAVCGSQAIHVLTDAAGTQAHNGVVGAIRSKQIILPNGVLLACYAIYDPFVRFAEIASQCHDFDALRQSANGMWEEARTVLGPFKDKRCGVLLAGWSASAGGLRMTLLMTRDGYRYSWPDASAIGAGPAPTRGPLLDEFDQRFSNDPDAFHPRRDGLALVEGMRRQYLREHDEGLCPAIGGFCQLGVLTPATFKAGILRHWPDEVGRRISIDGEAGPSASCGTAWPDIFKRRETQAFAELGRFLPAPAWIKPDPVRRAA